MGHVRFIVLLCLASIASAQTYYPKTSINPSILYSQNNWQSSGTNAILIPSALTGIGLNLARAGSTNSLNVADFFFHRSANYVGGSTGHVNASVYVKTLASSGALGYEWNGLFIMDNSGTLADASQNLALAAVAYKRSSGNTWARYAELDEDLADSTGTAVVDEVDLYANGTQVNNNRYIMHLQAGPGPNYAGVTHIENGIKFNPTVDGGGPTSNATVDNAWIAFAGDYKYGLSFAGGSSVAGSSTIIDTRTGSNLVYGLNMGGAYTSGFLFARDNKRLIWSSDQHTTSGYTSASDCLEDRTQSTVLFSVCMDGHLKVGSNTLVDTSGAITPLTTAGIVGTTAADSPNAGSVGEVASIHCVVGAAAAAATTITVTIATPAVVTWSSHTFVPSSGLANYTCPINFTTTGALPTGLTVGTNYYIIGSSVSGDTFQIADTAAHALAGTNAVATSGSQSGTQAAYIGNLGGSLTVYAGAGMFLTAGDWDCNALGEFQELTSLTTTRFAAGISNTAILGAIGTFADSRTASGSIGANSVYLSAPVVQQNISATTSVYAAVTSTFSVGTQNEGANLRCRRMR